MRRLTRFLPVLLTVGIGPAAAALDGEADVLELFAGLPVPFVVESAADREEDRVFRLRSAEPIELIAAGSLYLRASVTVSSVGDAEEAAAEVERRLAAADPDVGLSYAWDYVIAGGGSVFHLHADCTFSEEGFLDVALALARRVTGAGVESPASFWCRCGGGCRAGAPVSVAAEDAGRLPPVRRMTDDAEEGYSDEEEYDNRLDPSGAWASSIGELSLMHYANGLSFSYSAVFGPTAHICEGAGVAGLVGTDRYEFPDDQGTVAFIITETEVRMELVDGIASFCGAGWAGDRFTMDGFEPPGECTVAAEHSHFHVEDRLLPERRHTYVVRGDRVEVAPAWRIDGEEWVLSRFVGPRTTNVGLLAWRDLDCPTADRRHGE